MARDPAAVSGELRVPTHTPAGRRAVRLPPQRPQQPHVRHPECAVIDVKLVLLAGLALPLLGFAASPESTLLVWVLVAASLGAYCLAATELVHMLMGGKLPAIARQWWWALMLLRFTIGLPIGVFATLVYASMHPDLHHWKAAGIAFVMGWSGLALKPVLDRVLQRKIEALQP